MGVEINQSGVGTKKYHLGNQPQEYELVTKYLGHHPDSYENWRTWNDEQEDKILNAKHDEWPSISGIKLSLISNKNELSANLIIHQRLIKDAFPLPFYGEERARDWTHFLIVSTQENPEEKFIIPMH